MFCCANQDNDKTEVVMPPAQELSVEEKMGAPEEDAREDKAAELKDIKEPAVEEPKKEERKEEPKKEEPQVAPAAAKPPEIFEFDIDKGSGTLGMSVDSHGELLIVTGILSGALKAYNETAAAGRQVQQHDFIAEVNGKSGPALMIAELKGPSPSKLRLKVLRPVPFNVKVNKGGKTLGIRLAYSPTATSVGIKEVMDGAVKDYNATAAPDMQLKEDDRILSVNYVIGAADKLIEAMKAGDSVDFLVARPSP